MLHIFKNYNYIFFSVNLEVTMNEGKSKFRLLVVAEQLNNYVNDI